MTRIADQILYMAQSVGFRIKRETRKLSYWRRDKLLNF